MLSSLRHRLHEAFVRWALRVHPPEPAPIVLVQRRVYVLPTRAGLAYASALGVILLGAMNYNLSLGHALVFLLAGLGVVAILHTFRNLVLLEIRPGRCEPVFVGDLARFALVLQNRRLDARTSLRLFFGPDAPLEVDIGPHASTAATLGVIATRRGWLPMPRVTIETTWPLGLVRAWSYAVPDLNCLVYPAPAVKAPPLPWGGDAAQGTTRDGSGADDFSGLRKHQVADAPRHIAWKAVARQQDGPLLTKLFSGATAQQIWLDWSALPEAITSEQRLSILARWMLDANAAGLAWGLRIPTVHLAPDHGPAQLAAGLRALALYPHGTR
ncbi:MAG: DUF58 domain-containing protein [Sulfuritalea sp.]|nr:DUF58 domain-containing protein [Sulfuritalea sp.]MDP1981774.1 DUF58 domain-containing protein [Sulfuritalea sp.]